jgi:hypothetical protein
VLGRVFAHHWGRTIAESDAVLFVTQTHQYQPELFNEVHAAQLGHDRLPVSGLPWSRWFSVCRSRTSPSPAALSFGLGVGRR